MGNLTARTWLLPARKTFIAVANSLSHFGMPWYKPIVRIIARSKLREFGLKHPQAAAQLDVWYAIASKATWRSPADIKSTFGNASIVGSDRAVFNIRGNNYRLIVAFDFEKQIAFVKFVGSHSEYDEIDAATVQHKR